MGKTLSMVIGGLVAFLGLILLIAWWGDFLMILKGSVPALLIFGGAIALVAGISELKDSLKKK
jgi:hypothetical protein